MIQYRRLEKHELTPELFQDFIRHQTVQDCYRKREGRWVIEPAPFIDDWSREEYDFLERSVGLCKQLCRIQPIHQLPFGLL